MITLSDLAESLRCKTPSINHVIGFCSVKNIDGVGIITGIDGSYVKSGTKSVTVSQTNTVPGNKPDIFVIKLSIQLGARITC